MPDMTPERAIEFLLHVTACSGPFDYFEPEQNEALRMGAAALAEVAALRAENETLERRLCCAEEELAEAMAMFRKAPHSGALQLASMNWKCNPDCPACARDARWPKKEGT